MSKRNITVNEKFIIELQGQRFVKYEGLLDVAHQLGLEKLIVKMIQFPSEENNWVAISEATAITEDGKVFKDFGDSAPNSVNANLRPHLIRMASTRAKARVLRDLTNIGITALEEIDLDVMNGAKPMENSANQLMGKAIELQKKLVVAGKVSELGKITGGRNIETIQDPEILKAVIEKLEKVLEK